MYSHDLLAHHDGWHVCIESREEVLVHGLEWFLLLYDALQLALLPK